jgi:hypothetical protein
MLRQGYEATKTACQSDWGKPQADLALKQFVITSLRFLCDECNKVVLKSEVPGKEYFGFCQKVASSVVSRPANAALFSCNTDWVQNNWDDWILGKLSAQESARLSYSAALAPCLALEVFDRQNKKGPATYFECFVGHTFARAMGKSPEKVVTLAVVGRQARMTMDFLFHLSRSVRIHLAVKMSTRERVVQAWAHQRILNSAFGDGTYTGIMVLFGETKLDSRSLEVVEICVPDQWLVYQQHLSMMKRIYYFDTPSRYQQLTDSHPDVIQIKQFGQFFLEKEAVLGR